MNKQFRFSLLVLYSYNYTYSDPFNIFVGPSYPSICASSRTLGPPIGALRLRRHDIWRGPSWQRLGTIHIGAIAGGRGALGEHFLCFWWTWYDLVCVLGKY